MTNFRTEVNTAKGEFKISYRDNAIFIGSCFAENIGHVMEDLHYAVEVNPFGILYNPASVLNCLHSISNKDLFSEDHLIRNNGLWHSLMHHGRFSGQDKNEVLKSINLAATEGNEKLLKADILIITFGTAWIYEHKATGITVANCHKLPASDFNRRKMTVEEITHVYTEFLDGLFKKNNGIQVIISISPVRHLKDGAHENQLSKATLLLATDFLVNYFKNVHYFPAYEILLDDLRDYRFYKDDMTHPSEKAIEYIWEKFVDTYIPESDREIHREIHKLKTSLAHRPISASSEAYRSFLNTQLQYLEKLRSKYPFLNFDKEQSQLEAGLS